MVFVANKAQVSQVFTYISVILVVGAIVILGAKGILQIMSKNCEVKDSDFSRQIASFTDQYSDLGTVKFESLNVPCDSTEICFIGASALGQVTFTYPADAIIDDAVRDGTYNVFVKSKFTIPVAKIPKLETVNDVVVCIKVINDHAKVKFSGKGKTTLVEQG